MSYQLVWFKRDLRCEDHLALIKAAKQGPVRCIYVVEPMLWQQPLVQLVVLDFTELLISILCSIPAGDM